MIRHLLVCCSLLPALSLLGQVPLENEVRRPWAFAEGELIVLQPLLRAGTDYTTARLAFGQTISVMARSELSSWLSLGLGFGLAVQDFTQISDYDRVVARNLPIGQSDRLPRYTVRTDYGELALRIPLDLRAELFRVGPGRVYLRGGGGWNAVLISNHENWRVLDTGGNDQLVPEGELSTPSTAYLRGGIGFLVRESTGYQWYLELSFLQTTGNAIESETPFAFQGTGTYLRTMRYRSFGIGGGVGF